MTIEVAIRRILSLVPPAENPLEFLRHTLDEAMSCSTTEQSMGRVHIDTASAAVRLAAARTTVENLSNPASVAEDPEGIVNLATIEWLLRPALEISQGAIIPPRFPPWNLLQANIAKNLSTIVCRVDVSFKHSDPFQVGTGFLVGRSNSGAMTIMTNKHVVCALQSMYWLEEKNTIAYGRFFSEAGEKLFELSRSIVLHPEHDLALLTISESEEIDSFRELNCPISLVSPEPLEQFEIAVVGFPSFNSTRDPFPRLFGFGDRFGVMRFAPGTVRGLESRYWQDATVDVMLHDATTLSGSSGSCIVDLLALRRSEIKIVGLHFGGWPVRASSTTRGQRNLFEANGAVPLWMLASDEILSTFY